MSVRLRPFAALLAALLLLANFPLSVGRPVEDDGTPAADATTGAEASFLLRPSFEENLGQVAGGALFFARHDGVLTLLAPEGPLLRSLGNAQDPGVGIRFVGSAVSPVLEAGEPLTQRSHYFLGADPAGWVADAHHFGRVVYHDVYPSVDVAFYFNDAGELEYDLLLAAGADPSVVRIAFPGADAVELTPSGDLAVRAGAVTLVQRAPVSYEVGPAGARAVESRYVLSPSGEAGVEVGPRDPALMLVIDPVPIYQATFGGTGTDIGTEVALDGQGNAYYVGHTDGNGFPGSRPAGGGGREAYVMKVAPNGTVLYTTWLGGPWHDEAHAVAVDGSGQVYVAGSTEGGFPVASAFQATYRGGVDAFLTKLSPSGGVLASTYLGGSDYDRIKGIALDASGNVYLAGKTLSSDFPLAFALNPTPRGMDGFLAKMTPSWSSLVFSTRIGGPGWDEANDVVLDSTGLVHVAGVGAPDLVAPTVPGAAPSGGFVVALDPEGRTLVHHVGAAVLGSRVEGLAADARGGVYAVGTTAYLAYAVGGIESPGLGLAGPLPGGTFDPDDPGDTGIKPFDNYDAHIIKLVAGVPVYSARIGGTEYDRGLDVAVDGEGNAYVVGETYSPDFPSLGGRRHLSRAGGWGDGFVVRVNATGEAVDYSGTLPLSPWCENPVSTEGVAVSAAGDAYLTGYLNSCDKSQEAFIMKLSPDPPSSTPCWEYGYDEQVLTIPVPSASSPRYLYVPTTADPSAALKTGLWMESNGRPGLQTERCVRDGVLQHVADTPEVVPLTGLPEVVPLPNQPDYDRDSVNETDEVAGNSDPTRPDSTPTSDDDGDGVANEDEPTRLHAWGFLSRPTVYATASDRVTFHFGAPGATAVVTAPSAERMQVSYMPAPPQGCPGPLPRPAERITHDCTLPVVATFDLAGNLVSARGAFEPDVSVPASAFVVACASARPACLVGAGVDGTWQVQPAPQAPRPSTQARAPAGWLATIGGKTFDDVAPDSADVRATGSGQNSRDATMALRLWNWHEQAPGSTYQACSGGLVAPCTTEGPREENAAYATVFAPQ